MWEHVLKAAPVEHGSGASSKARNAIPYPLVMTHIAIEKHNEFKVSFPIEHGDFP